MAKKPAKGTPLYQESEVGNTGFGLRLRYNREAKRLSVEELANLAGVNATTLKEAERGNRVTLPLLKIAEILDLDLHWFRYGSDRKYENEKEHQLSEHILALMLEASKAPRGADRNAFLYVLADALDYEHLSEELTEQVADAAAAMLLLSIEDNSKALHEKRSEIIDAMIRAAKNDDEEMP
ncbi:MAG: helix-turn-helix domain-containing protein [Zoogloeaceae bacterium]|jgi:transcriptional regulator with XRE-family HTH domain|nr:helix-turn-helix domain-containing protein [Zoogloeaceae bacterium]